MEERKPTVTVEQIEDYEFRVSFDPEIPEMLVEEAPPLGQSRGPNPSRVLAAAVGSCLCSSLLFCLKKARAEPRTIKATVTNNVERNASGRLRVAQQDVRITVDMDVEGGKRGARCFELFEDFCTVTQSVRQGIQVNVEVVDPQGQELHRSQILPG
jgi:uncharacterized OsmC-like protein